MPCFNRLTALIASVVAFLSTDCIDDKDYPKDYWQDTRKDEQQKKAAEKPNVVAVPTEVLTAISQTLRDLEKHQRDNQFRNQEFQARLEERVTRLEALVDDRKSLKPSAKNSTEPIEQARVSDPSVSQASPLRSIEHAEPGVPDGLSGAVVCGQGRATNQQIVMSETTNCRPRILSMLIRSR